VSGKETGDVGSPNAKLKAASNTRSQFSVLGPSVAEKGAHVSTPPRPPRIRGEKRFAVTDLLRNTSVQARGTDEMMNAKLIETTRIERDPDQPRRTFPQESLDELAASLAARGVLLPILVRYNHDTDMYIVIDGERRWRAAKIAGLEKVPAVVVEKDQSEDERLVDQLTANIQREDLNDVDRAQGLKRLKAAMQNVPWELVADVVGIKRSRIYQLLDLLDPAKVTDTEREAIQRGALSEKGVRSVLRHLSGPKREGLQQVMVEDKLSVQEATAASAALVANPHITDDTPVAQVVEAIRKVRHEAKNPRPPQEWMDERAAVAGAAHLPVADAATVSETLELAQRLQTLLVAFTDIPVSPAAARKLRASVRRLRDAADLYLDQSR